MKIIIALILFVIFSQSSAAQAQNQCDKRDSILEMLANRYSEKTQAIGVTNKGGLIEVLTNYDNSTWTIIVTTPHGISCLVAAGEGWRTLKKAELDPNAEES